MRGENASIIIDIVMGELQKSLVGKSINGLGKIHGGSFSFNYSTDETSCYKQIFRITTYD